MRINETSPGKNNNNNFKEKSDTVICTLPINAIYTQLYYTSTFL